MTARIGVIGCGGMGRLHLQALRSLADIDVIALAEPDPDRLLAAATLAPSAKRFTNYADLLKEKLDLVIVATQAPQHRAIVCAAAAAGVPAILCEKPLALSLAEADEMIKACDESGTTLAVNHQMTLSEAVQTAKRSLNDGVLGRVTSFRIFDKGGRPGGLSLNEIGPHIFDLLHYFLGDATRVSATIETAGRPATITDIIKPQGTGPLNRASGLALGDRIRAEIETGGVSGHYESGDPEKETISGIDLIGTQTVARIRPWKQKSFFDRVKEKLRLVSSAAAADERAQAHLIPMYENVLTARASGRQPVVDGRRARAGLEVIMGIYESHRRQAPVSLPLIHREHPLERWLAQGNA